MPVDRSELALWLRNPLTVQMLEALRARFPEDQWKRLCRTDGQSLDQRLGVEQGRAEVRDFLVLNKWAEE